MKRIDPRKIWAFVIETPSGNFLGFVLLFGLVILWINLGKTKLPARTSNLPGPESPSTSNESAKTASKVSTFQTDIPTMKPIPLMNQIPQEQKPESQVIPQAAEPLPVNLYESETPSVSENYLPVHRLIECETVITIDSSKIQTPIIGLVRKDQWHDNRLIIPAGTEIHGMAQLDRSRERIGSQNNWKFVWRTPGENNGLELACQGIALANLPLPDGRGWALADGSAGLPGRVIKSDNEAELKYFIANFVGGLSSGLIETQSQATPYGTATSRITGTIKSGVAMGMSQSMAQWANLILQRIQQDGFYIRVPGATPFYLYTYETIDLASARRGMSLARETPGKSQ